MHELLWSFINPSSASGVETPPRKHPASREASQSVRSPRDEVVTCPMLDKGSRPHYLPRFPSFSSSPSPPVPPLEESFSRWTLGPEQPRLGQYFTSIRPHCSPIPIELRVVEGLHRAFTTPDHIYAIVPQTISTRAHPSSTACSDMIS